MIVDVDGRPVHAATGGVEVDGHGPGVVLVHGAGMDSTVWQLQTRFLAHREMRVVAVDLPAHGRSTGMPIDSIESMADWLVRLVEVVGFETAHVVGHSMGTFVALEMARRHPAAVSSITLCGTATEMAVHPALLDAADNDLPAAAALMAAWGHGTPAHIGQNPTPGQWMLGGARALVERSAGGVLATDFRACQNYGGALDAAAAVTCPATVVIGLGDKMTPAKGSRALAAALPAARTVELAGIGHSMMAEHPRAVRQAIVETVRSVAI